MKLLVKYHVKDIEKIQQKEKCDWIDLRAAETVHLKAHESAMISLGVSIAVPENHEAHIVPRSSTFKTWGVIQSNGLGVVDESYRGNDDVWKMPVYATRDTTIVKGDRICQFRIVEKQPKLEIIETDEMSSPNRGGFGSTGVN